ncbi:hypothetical protein ACL9RF_04135 [Sphingobacterium sp. Mn56C]|uniref:hypothetical protein n=1 Tax=Sphingobacterium sp. Mn56C TaxID=3395261 RepID=UPI003BD2C5EB
MKSSEIFKASSSTGKLSNYTLVQLRQQQKKYKAYVRFLCVLTLLLFLLLMYYSVVLNNYAVFILLGGFSCALFIFIIILKQIEAEISNRSTP